MHLSLPVQQTGSPSFLRLNSTRQAQINSDRSVDRVQFGINQDSKGPAVFNRAQAEVLLTIIFGESNRELADIVLSVLNQHIVPLSTTAGVLSEPLAKKHQALSVLLSTHVASNLTDLAHIISGNDWKRLYQVLPEQKRHAFIVNVVNDLVYPKLQSIQVRNAQAMDSPHYKEPSHEPGDTYFDLFRREEMEALGSLGLSFGDDAFETYWGLHDRGVRNRYPIYFDVNTVPMNERVKQSLAVGLTYLLQ